MRRRKKALSNRAYDWLLFLASRVVPREIRREWQARHADAFSAWKALVDRGELARPAESSALLLVADTVREAWRLSSCPDRVRSSIRSVWMAPVCFAGAMAAAWFATGGLPAAAAAVRSVLAVRGVPGIVQDRAHLVLIGIGLPVGFGIVAGAAIVWAKAWTLPWRGWRYALFFGAKTLATPAGIVVVWLEAKAALAAHISHTGLRVLFASLILRLALIAVLGWAIGWCFADQRRRCPVCLARLSLPVPLGSWSSVYDPAATELVCEKGHGTLVVPGTVEQRHDYWIPLDATWNSLFR